MKAATSARATAPGLQPRAAVRGAHQVRPAPAPVVAPLRSAPGPRRTVGARTVARAVAEPLGDAPKGNGPGVGEDLSEEERAELDAYAVELAATLGDIYENADPDELEDFLGGEDDDAALPRAFLDEDAPENAAAMFTAPVPAGERVVDEDAQPDDFHARLKRGLRPIKKQVPVELLPRVAVVGRPNVGKSALFNRIAGRSLAIVYDYPGVTRDRLYCRATWGRNEFLLIDTGGLMSDASKLPTAEQREAMESISEEGLPRAIERQAAAGVAEADAVILVVDGQTGPVFADEEVVDWLRRKHPKKPVVLAVNKCESERTGELQAANFWEWGHVPLPVSAISGTGTGELMDSLIDALPPTREEDEVASEDPLTVAIVGRPNVGKSSLLNSIIGEQRFIVCDLSGTTRDAVDTTVELPGGEKIKLVDTAGIRKRGKVGTGVDGAENLSVARAIRAMRRSDVLVLVIDAVDGPTSQDAKLATLAEANGRAVVVVVNKWDLIPNKDTNTMRDYTEDVMLKLKGVQWATIVFTDAVSGKRVDKVLEAVLEAGAQHAKRVSTATINMVVNDAVSWRSPPSQRTSGKKGRIYYGTQAAVRPPTFVMFCNDPTIIQDDYRRYIERSVRENIGFPGTPLRIYWKGKGPRVLPPGVGVSSR